MAAVAQFQVVLTGWSGGPGVNTYHYLGLDPLAFDQAWINETSDRLYAAYDGMKTHFVNGVTINLDPAVKVFDDATGSLTAVYAGEWQNAVTGAASIADGNVSRATQVCVRLITDGIHRNRLIQGRKFIGPITSYSMNSDGTVKAATRGSMEAAFDGMMDVLGLRLAVWARPVNGAGGKAAHVQRAQANVVPGTLRSRKT